MPHGQRQRTQPAHRIAPQGDRAERGPQPQPAARGEERDGEAGVGAEEAEGLGGVDRPQRQLGGADGAGPDLPADAVALGTGAQFLGQRLVPRTEFGDGLVEGGAQGVGAGQPGLFPPGPPGRQDTGPGRPGDGSGQRTARPPEPSSETSRDSSSSPADTVTSSVSGRARRAARMARTSKEGGRPNTASASPPPACNRTAAARS